MGCQICSQDKKEMKQNYEKDKKKKGNYKNQGTEQATGIAQMKESFKIFPSRSDAEIDREYDKMQGRKIQIRVEESRLPQGLNN